MIETATKDGRELVAIIRAAAAVHRVTWEALVPDRFVVNLDAEEAEDIAYEEMAAAKADLREHICRTYGISIRELSSLAMP